MDDSQKRNERRQQLRKREPEGEERSNEAKIEATLFKITQKTGLDYRS